jgi:hypothetical protein
MALDRDVVLGARPPPPGNHDQIASGAADAQDLFGRIAIEFPVQPLYEVYRRRLLQLALGCHPVDLCLDARMRCGLEL